MALSALTFAVLGRAEAGGLPFTLPVLLRALLEEEEAVVLLGAVRFGAADAVGDSSVFGGTGCGFETKG